MTYGVDVYVSSETCAYQQTICSHFYRRNFCGRVALSFVLENEMIELYASLASFLQSHV